MTKEPKSILTAVAIAMILFTGAYIVASYDSKSCSPIKASDLNNDGVVDALDLSILLSDFSKSEITSKSESI